MSSINIGSSTTALSTALRNLSTQSSAASAKQALAAIDSKGQGFIDPAELASSFTQIANDGAAASGTTDSSTSSTSSATAAADKLFKQLDSDSNGQVSQSELSNGLQSLSDALTAQFNQSRTTGLSSSTSDTSAAAVSASSSSSTSSSSSAPSSAAGGGSAGSSALSSSSSSKTYEAADTNEDGTVTQTEEQAYLQKLATARAEKQHASTPSDSSTGTSDKSQQVQQAYLGSLAANSGTLSASA